MKKGKRSFAQKKAGLDMEIAFQKFLTLIPEFRAFAEADKPTDDNDKRMMFIFFPFTIADELKKNPRYDYRRILQLVEYLACEGDEMVQTIMYTFFVESLLAVSDKFPLIMEPVLRSLGKTSREHALTYNKFNGTTNLGLDK